MSSERPEALRERSFGGVVLRSTGHGAAAELLVIVPRGRTLLALPKGGGEAGETGEQTATREVREETGVTATPRAPLGDVTYWYRRNGRAIRKTVHFFLFDYVSGSVEDHDHEVEEARWVPLAEAAAALAYPGEREMAARAAHLVAESRADR